MRILKGQLCTLYDILHRGGAWSTVELCKEMGFPVDFYSRERMRALIGQLRKKIRDNALNYENPWVFNDNGKMEELQWVGTTIYGYTLELNTPTRFFECRMRANQATGVTLNGAPAFIDLKRLAPQKFFTLKVDVQPKMLRMTKLLK